jgi:hypothetical protein
MKLLKRTASPSGRRRARLHLVLSLSEEKIPAAGALNGKQFDLNGLPIVVGSGPTNDVGLQAGHQLDLEEGFSADSAASVAREVDPATILSGDHGMSQLATDSTLRFQQSGWDIALSPKASTTGLMAAQWPNYGLGGSVTRQGGSGWAAARQARSMTFGMP